MFSYYMFKPLRCIFHQPLLLCGSERIYYTVYNKNGIISYHIFQSTSLEETNRYDVLYDRFTKITDLYITSIFLDVRPYYASRILLSIHGVVEELMLHHGKEPIRIPDSLIVSQIVSNVKYGCIVSISQEKLNKLSRMVGIGTESSHFESTSINYLIFPDNSNIKSIKCKRLIKLTCISVKLSTLCLEYVQNLTVNKRSIVGKYLIDKRKLEIPYFCINIDMLLNSKIDIV